MTVPHLPAELTDHVIDYLHNDPRALAACALTCRQWLPAARYHVFGDITLCASTCKTFAELIAASPELALVVRSVKLSSIILGSRAWQNVDFTFLHSLASVARLILSRVRIEGAVFDALVQTLPSVSHLIIHSCWFAGLYDFAAMASSFPHLQDLSISPYIACPTAEVTLPLPPLPVGLRSLVFGDLEFDQQPLNALIAWLANPRTPSSQGLISLSSLIVWRVWPTHILLENFAIHLQRLDLTVHTEMALSGKRRHCCLFTEARSYISSALFGKAPGFSLSGCINLQTFTLRMWLAGMCVQTNQDLPWIAVLLSQLCSPHLCQITFSLYTEDMGDLRTLSSENAVRKLTRTRYTDMVALDWDSIYATLSSENLPSLEAFVIEGAGPKELLAVYLQQRYPDLYRRGVFVLF